jgi:hypothetical protein
MRSEILPLDFGCGDFFFYLPLVDAFRACVVPPSPRTGFWCKIKVPGLLGTKQGARFSSLFRSVSSGGRSHGNAACGGKIVKEIPFSRFSFPVCISVPPTRPVLRPPAAGRTDCLSLRPCVCVFTAQCLKFSCSVVGFLFCSIP